MIAIQLEWLQKLAAHRTFFWNDFFKILNFFDTAFFYILVFLIVWLVFNEKMGIRLILVLGFNALLNFVLKEVFAAPRPCHLDPSLCLIPISEFGFPSGAAQGAMLLGSIWIYHFRKNILVWVSAIFYILLMSFSRLYLGVHFFTDVLGGLFLGGLVFLGYVYALPYLEKRILRLSLEVRFLLTQLAALCFLLRPYLYPYAFIGFSIGLGFYITGKRHLEIPPPRTLKEIFKRLAIVLASLAIFFVGLHFFPSIVVFYLLGLWMSIGCPYLINSI